MSITAPPIIPQITDPSTFAVRAQDWVVWQADELYPFITSTSAILDLSTSSTSTTSNSIGTGSRTFTVETGKGYVAGQSLSIASAASPTNRMFAVVTSYVTGTGVLVVNVQAIEGTGTFASWQLSLAYNGVVSTAQIQDLAVTNAKVANNTVALAKLARVGTAGQVLTSAGVGADPAYQAIPVATSAEYVTGTDNTKFLTSLVARSRNVVQGTAVASTSGTSIDFTGIPNWVKRITVMLSGVSTNGTSKYLLQLGGGSIEVTGYLGSSNSLGTSTSTGEASSTAGLTIARAISAADTHSGVITIVNLSGNLWSISSSLYNLNSGNPTTYVAGGNKTTAAALDRIRLTTVNGTDTFDAGSINILYQ